METSKAEHDMNLVIMREPKEYPNLITLLESKNRYSQNPSDKSEPVPTGKLTELFYRKNYKNIARKLRLPIYPPVRFTF